MLNGLTQKEKVTAFLTGIITGLVILVIALYQVPEIRDRFGWRIDFAKAFLRGVVNPVKPIPTAVVSSMNAFDPDSFHPIPIKITPTLTSTIPPLPEQTLAVTATTIPTPLPTLTPTPIPGAVKLPAPLYEKQDINNCGPATLSMHLRYYGWEGTQKTISDLLKPRPEDRNVNVEELVAYVNTEVPGIEVIYRVGGDLQMLKKLLAAGFPVTIEEAFIMSESYWFNDDRWAGHYLLLTGYDDEKQLFLAQDPYVGPNLSVSYQTLDRNWQAFNRVYMVVYPTEQRSEVQSILADQWDVNKNREHALKIAQNETEADSTDSFAWFNLGTNLVYFEKYSQAAGAYDHARNNELPQRMLRYQFGPFFAYFHTGRIDELMLLTDYALDRTPNSEEAMLWRGWAFYRQGDKGEAEKMFLSALNAQPFYSDAQYGLDFVRNN